MIRMSPKNFCRRALLTRWFIESTHCNFKLHLSLTSSTTHIRIVPSSHAVAMNLLSPDQATSERPSSCPMSDRTIFPVWTSQILTILSAASAKPILNQQKAHRRNHGPGRTGTCYVVPIGTKLDARNSHLMTCRNIALEPRRLALRRHNPHQPW
jgi:hypothetical protein